MFRSNQAIWVHVCPLLYSLERRYFSHIIWPRLILLLLRTLFYFTKLMLKLQHRKYIMYIFCHLKAADIGKWRIEKWTHLLSALTKINSFSVWITYLKNGGIKTQIEEDGLVLRSQSFRLKGIEVYDRSYSMSTANPPWCCCHSVKKVGREALDNKPCGSKLLYQAAQPQFIAKQRGYEVFLQLHFQWTVSKQVYQRTMSRWRPD